MTHDATFNDIPAPDGFVYVAAPGLHEAHLSPEDESEILTLCGAPAESPVEFETLPHAFEVCPICLRIADEASNRPV